jgi:hypothetical protein
LLSQFERRAQRLSIAALMGGHNSSHIRRGSGGEAEQYVAFSLRQEQFNATERDGPEFDNTPEALASAKRQ